MQDYAIYFAIASALLLFIYTFRTGFADHIYAAVKNWRRTGFIAICILGGVYAGFYNSDVEMSIGETLALLAPAGDDDPALTQIQECKRFITEKLEHRDNESEPSAFLDRVTRTGARSVWDTCAWSFGMNYWKDDISINGESGGKALCRAYHQDSYRSRNVENWCKTVFTPAQKT